MFGTLILLFVASIFCALLIHFIPFYLKKYLNKRKYIVIRNMSNIREYGHGQLPRTKFEEFLFSYHRLLNRIYDTYDSLWKKNLYHTLRVSILVFYFLTVFIQKILKIRFVNLSSGSSIEIFSLIAGILGTYGIYIGFLQYVTEYNEQTKYLGKNKTSYLLKDLFWYRFSQSKSFIISLFITIIIPIIVKTSLISESMNLYLIYLWQSSICLLLLAFIFLLKISLFLINIMSSINTGSDYNLQSVIQEGVRKEYIQKFWLEFKKELRSQKYNKDNWNPNAIKQLSYKIKFLRNHISMKKRLLDDTLESNFLYKWLKYDTNNLSKSEKIEFIELVFSGIQIDIYNKIENNNKLIINNSKEFYRFYKFFVQKKWQMFVPDSDEFSFTINKPNKLDIEIPFESWYILLKYEIKVFNLLLKNADSKELWDNYIKKTKFYEDFSGQAKYSWSFSDKTVENFLWQMILKHPDLELQKVYDDLVESTEKVIYENEFKKIILKKTGKTRILKLSKYRFNKLYKEVLKQKIASYKRYNNYNYYKENFETFKWRQFWRKRGLFVKNIDYLKNDWYKSKRAYIEYSKILFESLGFSRQTFSSNLKNCILSMNEEYRLAFMLSRLLYTDGQQWDDNLSFYDLEINKIMSSRGKNCEHLFKQTKTIILSTDINHRITEMFLDRLWKTKLDIITDFSWFNQFGQQHRQSDIKIIYIQCLLSREYYSYSRLNLTKLSNRAKCPVKNTMKIKLSLDKIGNIRRKRKYKKQKMSEFCRDYFILTDRLGTIFTKESFSHKENKLQLSVEYLLFSENINLSNVIKTLSVTSLLRLEWIFRWKSHRYYKKNNYTSRVIFESMSYHSKYGWYDSDGVLEFYSLKVVDDYYCDVYSDLEFIEGFKNSLVSVLNSNNNTTNNIDEYVKAISNKLPEDFKISTFQQDKIICALTDMVFHSEEQNNKKTKKKYRYK
ncbi:hypothetical protein HMPREF9381_1655 [Streptococcus sanguinis SK72]|uniref:Uncharacterized protein n=1 Tax=Streptococcus sanguinis SK72 TaxID=888809 RepID=F0I3B5_STRSA|nr:hypothetical protein [Streptococcus sanguinis]EGD29174.1 hypothetical protein HMPREF9381_1655 [Streptococcus sanguinis SK72]